MGLVACHTGAGNNVIGENYRVLCKRASAKGLKHLEEGNSVLDAVEKTIKILEDNSATNAGTGSNLNWDGAVECEAGIMDSQSNNFGSCSCVSDVKNPISLARRICDKQNTALKFGRIPPLFLSGYGASSFAKEVGLEIVSPDQLISKKAQTTYNFYRHKISEYEEKNAVKVSRLDTVGALAIDDDGNIAAGCSSGGIILKLQGRVGHAPIFGSGVWAQNIGNHSIGCVTTGNGEYLIKTLLAREICTSLINSQCPTTKLNQILNEKFLKSPLLPPTNDSEYYAGALVIDYNSETKRGELLWAHTTKMLCLGYKSSSQKSAKFVSSSLPDQSQAGHKVVVQGITF